MKALPHYRRISFKNIQSDTPRLIKENDIFKLIENLVPFGIPEHDIPFEDRYSMPRVIPSNTISARYHYGKIPTNDIFPEVTDLYVCLPKETYPDRRRLCLQNGWYLNYRGIDDDSDWTYDITLFHPRITDCDGEVFQGRLEFTLGGGGQGDDEKNNNIYDLINEIGMDIKIPLYDKLCITMKMKEIARKQKNDIVINL